ncbi:inositol phospholipid synthesis and fat-storage-inducing TM-domain-containing protein [Mycena floridula]|nr:inositol phospholipid synthesis and fat-storage-inducing TM-domain-containing protein [Mycena floridula]
MPDLRKISFFAISGSLFFAVIYSVVYGTYLDTSNPLLSHLPHPLSNSSYWAQKSNFINVYFIKWAWAWTTAAFFFSWFTAPAPRSNRRIGKWLIETAAWMIFTGWFFGPAVFDRVLVASGAECVVITPDGHVPVPVELCFDKSAISHNTHPQLFSNFLAPSPEWKAIPRLKKGHDVSGHIFLLTMATLFLADQLRPAIATRDRSTIQAIALLANFALILLWLFAIYTTGVYFHSPFEKVSGYVLGVAAFSLSQLPILQ